MFTVRSPSTTAFPWTKRSPTPPPSTTWSRRRVADCSAPSRALAVRQVSFDKNSFYADVVGEVETEGKVLVVKRIRITFHLAAHEGDRETIERVVQVYADSCPVARSIRDSIEITSELDLTEP